MITKQFTISASTVDSIVQHLETIVRPELYINNKPGTYAKNRRECWLNIHPPLWAGDKGPDPNSPNQFAPGLMNNRLWTYCQRVAYAAAGWYPNTGLAVVGENGIQAHRDSSNLTAAGVTINLDDTNFLYAKHRDVKIQPDRTMRPEDHIVYTLNKGDVLTFNSKFPHAIPNPRPGRWAIILWRVKTPDTQTRRNFETFRQKHPEIWVE